MHELESNEYIVRVPVKVLMYKGTSKDNPKSTITDKSISWWTNSMYSHCEIVVNRTHITVAPETGIVIDDAIPEDKTPKVWDIIELSYEVTQKQYLDCMQFIHSLEDAEYDWKGILLCQFLKIGLDRTDKWYCSELVSKILQILGEEKMYYIEPHRINPGDVSEILTGMR